MGRWASLLAAACLAWACGVPATETYSVRGRVERIDAAAGQVEIDHQDIAGFMPAMKMNFDVASPELLEDLEPGSHVRFELERSGTTLRVLSIEVVAPPAAGFVPPGEPPVPESAPDFELIGHDGEPFRLSSLRGRAVLLDFVFTRCKGPCPILTAAHARLQRRLPDDVARRTHFVSVSLDPEHDRPQELRDYARARRADLEGWTFCTGAPTDVQEVLDAYHIGTVRTPDGELDHLVVTFLIGPDGTIERRYPGLEIRDEEIIADLREVLT